MEQQMEQWLQEQREICSRVILLPEDETDDSDVANSSSQQRFHKKYITRSNIGGRYFGGVDVSFPEDDKNPSVAVYVIVDASDDAFPVVYQDSEYFTLEVPYVPSFLAFREIEPLVRLVQKQQQSKPDLTPSAILVDGNGLLHPRGAGIACFLGVRTGIPTIGIGKTLFCEGGLTKDIVAQGIDESLMAVAATAATATTEMSSVTANGDLCVWMDQTPITSAFETTDGEKETKLDRKALLEKVTTQCHGLAVPLQLPLPHNLQQSDTETTTTTTTTTRIACALVGHGGRSCWSPNKRRRVGTTKPIFVSVGHKISISQAVQIAIFFSHARIPEPVRQADLVGRHMLRHASLQLL